MNNFDIDNFLKTFSDLSTETFNLNKLQTSVNQLKEEESQIENFLSSMKTREIGFFEQNRLEIEKLKALIDKFKKPIELFSERQSKIDNLRKNNDTLYSKIHQKFEAICSAAMTNADSIQLENKVKVTNILRRSLKTILSIQENKVKAYVICNPEMMTAKVFEGSEMEEFWDNLRELYSYN